MVVLIVFPLFAYARLSADSRDVISDSDSDSKFARNVQEVTRWSLMTVELSPVREAVSDSDDDEEKVAVKRLLLVKPRFQPILGFQGRAYEQD